MLSIRNRPTPTPTVTISTMVSMAGTLSASTVRSGSDTVTAMPSRKLTSKINGKFRDLVSFAPMWLPMGVMDTSLPRVNKPMPTISITEPMRKDSIKSACMGTNVRHITPTMMTMGSTEAAASLNFSSSCPFCVTSPLLSLGVGGHLHCKTKSRATGSSAKKSMQKTRSIHTAAHGNTPSLSTTIGINHGFFSA